MCKLRVKKLVVYHDAVHLVTGAGGHREENSVVWQCSIKLVGHVTFFSHEERCVTNPTMLEKDAQLREDRVQHDDFS